MNNGHVFAIFIKEGLAKKISAQVLTIKEKELVFRLASVLRLKTGQPIILFDDQSYALASVFTLDKNSVSFFVTDVIIFSAPKIQVHLFLAMPKKTAFEEALYFAVEAGAVSITPLITSKSQSWFLSDRDQHRLQNIIISAREQAKSFPAVTLNNPIVLTELPKEQLIFFDAEGMPFFRFREEFLAKTYNLSHDSNKPNYLSKRVIYEKSVAQNININVLIGSEAGFTPDETTMLLSNPKITRVALTSNILRVPEAVLLACALFNLRD